MGPPHDEVAQSAWHQHTDSIDDLAQYHQRAQRRLAMDMGDGFTCENLWNSSEKNGLLTFAAIWATVKREIHDSIEGNLKFEKHADQIDTVWNTWLTQTAPFMKMRLNNFFNRVSQNKTSVNQQDWFGRCRI